MKTNKSNNQLVTEPSASVADMLIAELKAHSIKAYHKEVAELYAHKSQHRDQIERACKSLYVQKIM